MNKIEKNKKMLQSFWTYFGEKIEAFNFSKMSFIGLDDKSHIKKFIFKKNLIMYNCTYFFLNKQGTKDDNL